MGNIFAVVVNLLSKQLLGISYYDYFEVMEWSDFAKTAWNFPSRFILRFYCTIS